MSETPVAEINAISKEAPINTTAGRVEISLPHVVLDSEGEPLKFSVTLEKLPTPVPDGANVENIIIDRESPKLQGMLKQAEALKDIPNKEKPRKLLEILRSNVNFAYDDALNELANSNPELSKWVAENTGIASSSARVIKLSEVVDSGYGICRHLSVGMLALAREAGLKGAFLANGFGWRGNDPMPVKNVIRKDNGQPIFKMSPVGVPIGPHAWVELEVGEGEWMPVDPSAQLIGDTPEGIETFKEANYRPNVRASLNIDGLPNGVDPNSRDLEFYPGEATHTGLLSIKASPIEKPIRLGRHRAQEPEESGPWPKQRIYEGPLNLSLPSEETKSGVNVAVLSAQVAA